MLKSLTLKNFGKWEDVTVNFTEGLNVIRAANEHGKSTLYRAIAYAFWGARALPLSLDETVTWGKPVGQLKVTMEFDVAGVVYKITRGKSGAELTAPGVTVSGHEGVTSYVEALTKASMTIGMSTLLSNQSSLAGSLDKSAIALIEKLSNMSLVDEVITKIQEKLPCGATKALEVSLAEDDGPAPVADFSAENAALAAAQDRKAQAEYQRNTVKTLLDNSSDEAQAALQRAQQQKATDTLLESLRGQYALAGVPVAPVEPESVDIAALERGVAEAKVAQQTRAAWKLFQTIKPYHSTLRATVLEVAAQNSYQLSEVTGKLQQLRTDKAVAEASFIKGTACGLCGESYDNIPDVVKTNKKLSEKVKCIIADTDTANTELNRLVEANASINRVVADDVAIEKLALKLGTYVEVEDYKIPRVVKWVGPAVDESDGPEVDYAAMLDKARKAQTKYAADLARYQQVCKQRADLEKAIAEADIKIMQDGDALLQQVYNARKAQLTVFEGELTSAVNNVALMQERLQSAKAVFNATLNAHHERVKAKEFKRELLKEMTRNNALIKKLRDVRPVVARELWNLVIQGISVIFSQIRGVHSVVTRADDRFLVDGKMAEAYSGSTKDALGLAIRAMSQKTFMPEVDFTLLDEPASGADEVRETAMLATLTRIDFKQTILVTHSALADTFAANVITL